MVKTAKKQYRVARGTLRTDTEFPGRLRAHRANRGLRQVDVAHLAGVAKLTYLRWETGKSLPRLTNLSGIRQLAKRYGVTAEWLLRGETNGDKPHGDR